MSASLTQKTLQQSQSAVEALIESVSQIMAVGEQKAAVFLRQEKTIEGKLASANDLIGKLTSGELAIALSLAPDFGLNDLKEQADTLLMVLANGVQEEQKALDKVKAAKESDPEYRIWKATKTAIYNQNKSKLQAAMSAANVANTTKLAEIKKSGGWTQFVEGTKADAVKAAKDACYKGLKEGQKPTRLQIHEALVVEADILLRGKYQKNVELDGVIHPVPSYADICKDLANAWDASK